MNDVLVIEDPAIATVALDPVRSRILAELAEPASASDLAERLGLPRQKVNYHLRTLEAHGLATLAEKRRWGGITERLLVAKASAFVVSPEAMGRVAVDPERSRDRLSAAYLVALAARLIHEVGALMRKADEVGKRLPTLSIDTEIRFRSAVERAEFTEALANSIAGLVARYHDASAPGGRSHRLVVAAHPLPHPPSPPQPQPSSEAESQS